MTITDDLAVVRDYILGAIVYKEGEEASLAALDRIERVLRKAYDLFAVEDYDDDFDRWCIVALALASREQEDQ